MALIQQLQTLAGRATLDKPLYYAIQDAGRELITRLGNQSNLILDPDLDSYYTMSLLVLRFPELQDLIGRLAGQSVEYARQQRRGAHRAAQRNADLRRPAGRDDQGHASPTMPKRSRPARRNCVRTSRRLRRTVRRTRAIPASRPATAA